MPPVLPTTSFRFRFDRLLLPSSAIRQSICARPYTGTVINANDCSGGITFRPSYDPVRREIIYRQDIGQVLTPSNTYELTVYSTTSASDPGGIVSFDGIPLATPLQQSVFVGAYPAGKKLVFDTPPSGKPYCDPPDPSCSGTDCARSVRDIFSGCAYGGCHATSTIADAGDMGLPAEGLQLGSPELLQATAINHTAHETETGEDAVDPDPSGSGLRFGRAMPILDLDTSSDVSGGVPGNSYLIYKLLVFPGLPLEVPFPPNPGDRTLPPPEVVRLRNELVVGMPMPPMNGLSVAFLHKDELEWISQWVTQGMPMQCE